MLVGVMICLHAPYSSASGQSQNQYPDKIAGSILKIEIGDKAILVELNDNPAAKNLVKMLPLDIEFRDYNGTEKIAELPEKLKVSGSPDKCDPVEGSFTYFIPWGNLAIFYRDFRPSNNLVPLGKIISGMEILKNENGPFRARLTNNTPDKE